MLKLYIMAKKILIVDDDLDLLDCLDQALSIKGYDVIKCDSGQAAIRAARADKPDAILLDIVLPDLSGGEVARLLDKDPQTKKIPVIFLTGLLTHEEAKTVIKGKAFLGKPYSIDDVVEAVEEHTQG